ncbi:prolyl 4-hydroxylase [Seminavis robusta]|uniref:Prolyl 4-hydroxylase n=1 Tax=Seminavis robusta TaxID=568900 RepID=A0A9N8E046_9STRA|nr:prolyl 4-hydroxylase [Seminavis robusta]|eukprot:Sro514_g158060.1 prolyl 4-hydroxylase (170) ;mRNA; r:28382-28891
MHSLSSFLWCVVAMLLLCWTPISVHAVSECVATGEEMTSFECFTSGSQPRDIMKCEDTDKRCEIWAKQGECKSNPQYMLIYCKKSCESCISGHAGEVQVAPDPKVRSKVIKVLVETQQYLKEQADFKAKILRTCRNNNQHCAHFAALGECDKNPKFMHENCGPACKTCK